MAKRADSVAMKSRWVRTTAQKAMQVFSKCLLGYKKVPLRCEVGKMSYTDNKEIVASVSNDEINLYDKKVLLKCLKVKTAHECGHVLYTEDEPYGNCIIKICDYWADECNKVYVKPYAKVLLQAASHMVNSIEDGRIEQKLFKFLPYLKPLFKWYRGNDYQKSPCSTTLPDLPTILNQILMIATVHTEQKEFNNLYDKTKVFDTVGKIKPLILEAITNNQTDACNKFFEISKYLTEYVIEFEKLYDEAMQHYYLDSIAKNIIGGGKEKANKVKTGKKQSSKSKMESDTSGSGSCSEGEDNTGVSEKPEKNETKSESSNPKDVESKTNDTSKNLEVNNTSENNSLDTLFDSDMNNEEQLTEEIKNADEQTSKDSEKQLNKMEQERTEEESFLDELENMTDAYEDLEGEQTKFFEYTTKRNPPMKISNFELQRNATILKRAVDQIFRNKQAYDSRNLKSGKIDIRNLHKLCVSDNQMFCRKGHSSKWSGACFILKDGSGSMNGAKNNLALDSLTVIEEAMTQKMPLKIAEFNTTGHNVVHQIIKDWDEKESNYSFSFGKGACGGNKDGFSIRVATKELLRRTEDKKMLIIMSDGEPTDYRGKLDGYSDVKHAVKEARDKGIQVFSIYFGNKSFIERSRNSYKIMYEKDYFGVCTDDDKNNITEELKKIFRGFLE